MLFAQLAQQFHQAALDPTQWMSALSALASATRSTGGQLIGIGGRHSVPFNWCTNVDPRGLDEFVEINGADPRISFRIAASIASRSGETVFERHYDRARAEIGDGIYEEFCDRYDIPFGCQTILEQEDDRLIGLALLRGRLDGPTTARDRALFTRIAPHIRSAVDLQTAIEGRGSALLRGSLDAIGMAAIFIDGFGKVAGMTPAAEQALARTRLLSVARSELRCAVGADERRLRSLIGQVIQAVPPAGELVLGGGGEAPLMIAVHHLPAQDWSLGASPRAIVLLNARNGRALSAGAMLQKGYGLTAAEAEVACALAQGSPRAEIAAQRGVSPGTVHQQLKMIYVKTGVHREAELIALIAELRDA